MAKTPKTKTIRFDQFKRQLADVGVDELQPVELAEGEPPLLLRLGINLGGDPDEFRAFMEGIEAADDPTEIAEIILGYNPDEEPAAALERFHNAGGKDYELVALWGAETQGRREKLGKLRTRRS